MALSAVSPPLRRAPSEVRLALWIFWCAFMASSAIHRAVLIDTPIASPSVLAILGVRSLVYGALSLQILRGAQWARTSFAMLLAADAVDTILNAWLFIGNPLGVPHVPFVVGIEIAFDAIYAYATYLLFSEPGTAWFTGMPPRNPPKRTP